MRLIDADAFKEYIKNGFRDATNLFKSEECRDVARQITDALCRDIDKQPIAYDIDQVIRQLKEERELSYADFDRYVEEVSPCLDTEYDNSFQRGLERAIKIIKRQVTNMDDSRIQAMRDNRVYISGPVTGIDDYMERIQQCRERIKRARF